MANTPSDILGELGIRAFTGSRDVPKDDEKAIGLLNFAKRNAKSEQDIYQTTYYETVLNKFKLMQDI